MVVTIGAEIEYSVKPGLDAHNAIDLSALELEREFYQHQIEYNDILIATENSPQAIENALKEVVKKIKRKATEVKRALNRNGKRWKVYVSAIPFKKYDGLIWNGLHLHIKPETIAKIGTITAAAVYLKHIYSRDMRFITSHHIWGAFRNSNYSFKRKLKFAPVIVSQHETIEFRLFSFEDIANREMRKRIAKFFHTIYNLDYSRRISPQIRRAMGWDNGYRTWVEIMRELTEMPCELPYDFRYVEELGIKREKYEDGIYESKVYAAVGDRGKVIKVNYRAHL
jgi:hypothetical protein